MTEDTSSLVHMLVSVDSSTEGKEEECCSIDLRRLSAETLNLGDESFKWMLLVAEISGESPELMCNTRLRMVEFQWFLIAQLVRPGKSLDI